MAKKTMIKCYVCEYKGPAKKYRKTGDYIFKNILYMLISLLLCWTIIAPIIYISWVVKSVRKNVCYRCGSSSVEVIKK